MGVPRTSSTATAGDPRVDEIFDEGHWAGSGESLDSGGHGLRPTACGASLRRPPPLTGWLAPRMASQAPHTTIQRPSSGPSDGGVAAVVVTHNRRASLEQCLDALAAQTRRVDEVLVVDNASSDGTAELLRTRSGSVRVETLQENTGGAGGFRHGLARAHVLGYEWIWLMDDDTIPRPDALAALLAAERVIRSRVPETLVLARRVIWTDGRLHPMNQPRPKTSWPELVAAAELGYLPLRAASFVSLLVHRRAIDVNGLPHGYYFVWNDDLEYTARLLRAGRGFWIPASVVEHRTSEPYTAATSDGARFYFDVRNRLFMMRSNAWSGREKLQLARHLEANVRRYLLANRLGRAAVRTVVRGARDGLRPPRGGDGDGR